MTSLVGLDDEDPAEDGGPETGDDEPDEDDLEVLYPSTRSSDSASRHRALLMTGVIRTDERKFNPAQPRDPGGEDGGQWIRDPIGTAVGAITDLLDKLPDGPDTYYHGTRSTIDTFDREIFITTSKGAALGYLEGGRGKVYAVRLDPKARIAREDELRSAAADVFDDTEAHFGYQPYTFELADDPAVRRRLADLGFVGAEFEDLGPDNSYQHPTVVMWDGSALTPEADVDIPEHDRSFAMARSVSLDSEVRALDGDEFEAYWTRGKGLARWRSHPHPWTRLRNLLRKHVGPGRAERIASSYFHKVFGYWPGHRKGENPVGPG